MQFGPSSHFILANRTWVGSRILNGKRLSEGRSTEHGVGRYTAIWYTSVKCSCWWRWCARRVIRWPVPLDFKCRHFITNNICDYIKPFCWSIEIFLEFHIIMNTWIFIIVSNRYCSTRLSLLRENVWNVRKKIKKTIVLI